MENNLLQKASILLTPTAYNDGSMLSVKPENGDGDFTFSRGSAATRVNAQGLVENVQIISSELVSNGNFSQGGQDWTPNINATLSIDNGRLKVAVSDGSGYPSQNITTIVGKKYKITADAFIGTATKVSLYSAAFGFNDLTADGSYNLTFTATSTSTQIRLYVYEDGTYGFWDNISVKEITDDTDLPRIDYTDGCGSWLLEPQSTNLITYSEDISDSSWLKTSSGTASIPAITSNYSISPDGTLNASRVVFDLNGGTTSSDFSQLQHNISSTIGLSYTSSVYMKSNNDSTYNLTFIPVSGSTNIVEVTPQWKRFDLSAVLSSSNMRIRTRGSESSGDVTDISIWGAQIEQQSYATSYIPTNGAIATRLADVANNSGNSTLINSTEGVLYVEIAALADDGTNRIFGLSNNSNFSESIILRYSSLSNRISAQVRKSGSYEFTINYDSTDVTAFSKIAFKYKQNDFALWVNGIEVGVASSGDVISGLDTLGFSWVGGNIFYGKAKALAVYKEALTDAQLQSLTTI